jgi:hypothetical protein
LPDHPGAIVGNPALFNLFPAVNIGMINDFPVLGYRQKGQKENRKYEKTHVGGCCLLKI